MSGISMQDFFPQNQSVGYFFLKSPILRLKSQMVGPLAVLRLLLLVIVKKDSRNFASLLSKTYMSHLCEFIDKNHLYTFNK